MNLIACDSEDIGRVLRAEFGLSPDEWYVVSIGGALAGLPIERAVIIECPLRSSIDTPSKMEVRNDWMINLQTKIVPGGTIKRIKMGVR